MTENQIKTLSKLAMITVSETEAENLAKDLEKLSKMSDALAAYGDGDGSVGQAGGTCHLRSDEPRTFEDTDLLISCSTQSQNGYVLVPSSIKEDHNEQ